MIGRGVDILLVLDELGGPWLVADLGHHHLIADLEGATIGAKLASLEDDGYVLAHRHGSRPKRWEITREGRSIARRERARWDTPSDAPQDGPSDGPRDETEDVRTEDDSPISNRDGNESFVLRGGGSGEEIVDG